MANVYRTVCLASVVAALAACGGGGGGGPNPAATLCDQMIDCGALDSSFRSFCINTIEVYIPDPEGALDCIEAQDLTCEDLESDEDMQAISETCFFDTSQSECASPTSLTVCSPATEGHPSVCKVLDCSSACEDLGGSGDCGFDADDGYDKCFCYI